jgi:hypothetical protein
MAWLMRVVMQTPTEDKAKHILSIVAGRVTWRWLKAYDADGMAGFGLIDTTDNRAEARRFPSLEAVLECWRTQIRVQPLRDDGRPNRPLTAHSIEPVDESKLPPEGA